MCVSYLYMKLRYLKDNNTVAHSVESGIFFRDSSKTSCMTTHRWQGVTRDHDIKANSDWT